MTVLCDERLINRNQRTWFVKGGDVAERVRDNPPLKRKNFTLESQSIGCLMEGRGWHFSDLSGLGPGFLSDAAVQLVNGLLGPQPCLVT